MPIHGDNAADCGINDRNIIHVVEVDGYCVWETVHDQREQCPAQEDDIGDETVPSKPEWAMLDVFAPTEQETGYWDRVADVEEHYTRCSDAESTSVPRLCSTRGNIPIESCVRDEIEAPDN